MTIMDFWFYITIIVVFSLFYYGYDTKKKYDLKQKNLELEHALKIKEIELEEKKLDLEMRKMDPPKLEISALNKSETL